MPFVLTHSASFKQTIKLIHKTTGVKLDFPGWFYIMRPDTKGPKHAYDIPKNEGNIFSLIEKQYDILRLMIDTTNKPKFYIEPLVYINHYISDALSIGQISSEFWGKWDDLIDARMEFVCNKTADPVYDYIYRWPNRFINAYKSATIEMIIDSIMAQMEMVYILYAKEAKSIKFLLGKDDHLRSHTWGCVNLSASITAGIFYNTYSWRLENGK
jgi:hypothetical protein